MPLWRPRTVTFLSALAVAGAVLGGSATADGPASPSSRQAADPRPSVKLAFVCAATTSKVANDYKSLLEKSGFAAELIGEDGVAKADFTPYAAVLIGPDTKWRLARGGKGAPPLPPAAVIDGAKKPILGLGEAGYGFFGELKLSVGAGKGWHGRETSVRPVAPERSPIWSRMKVPVKEGTPVKLYESTSHVGIGTKRAGGADLKFIGQETGDNGHYPLIQEGSRYVLWGFQAGPDRMTDAGKELFVAVCRHASELGKPNDNKEAPGKDKKE